MRPRTMNHLAWRRVVWALGILCSFSVESSLAETFTIDTPGGPVRIDISHISPQGSMVRPDPPASPGFHPPSVFSPPLPSGSGARALGQAGAFTAVADDATAASWNPAGLTQLERPEASTVYRFTDTRNEHRSGDDSYTTGSDDFQNDSLNYFSFAYPLTLQGHNVVVSFNYQEAYDFTQSFSARSTQSAAHQVNQSGGSEQRSIQRDQVTGSNFEFTVTSYITTRTTDRLSQLLQSDLLTGIEFQQQGIIDAVSPALAFQVNRHLSLGLAFNAYADRWNAPIRSTTAADYEGESDSDATIVNTQTTDATYEYHGMQYQRRGSWPTVPIEIPSTTGTYPSFADTRTSVQQTGLRTQGHYEEINEFDDLQGYNLTLGVLYSVSSRLSIGLALDLPWTADARQKKTVQNTVTTYDRSGTTVLSQESSTVVDEKDVEFDFPLYWSAGLLWKWTDRFFSSLDASQTRWSDFSFQADGEERVNPLDGSPYGEHPIDDCWSVRYGMEYLLLLERTEIPFRGGLLFEERPAIGDPDEYWGFTLGSGFSVGKDPGKLIIDVAYQYLQGNDVMGSLVPEQKDLQTDSTEQSVYASAIWHF